MTYPVIRRNPPAHLVSFANERAASGCTTLAVKENVFQSARYVDSDGREFRVLRADLPPEARGLRGWLRGLANPFICAELTFSETGASISLEELKEKVLAELARDPEFYNAGGELSHIRGRVQRSKNHRELIACFLD